VRRVLLFFPLSILSLLLAIPALPASAKALKPSITVSSVSPSFLYASGGNVSIQGSTTSATSCLATVKPAVSPAPSESDCNAALARINFGANPGLKAINFKVSITATGPGGKTTTSVLISQHAPIKMAMFGDSVAYQDSPSVAQSLAAVNPDISLTVQVFPGTNLCHWVADIASTLKREHPLAVILQFGGIGAGACAKHADPNAVPYSAQDIKQIKSTYGAEIGTLLKGKVALVDVVPFPIGDSSNPTLNQTHGLLMRSALRDAVTAASSPSVIFSDAGNSVLDGQGRYTQTLPCLAEELSTPGHCWGPIIDGVPSNYVRADDGMHLCNVFWPTTGTWPTTGCPGYGYSSGAFRMGRAIASPILSFFGWS